MINNRSVWLKLGGKEPLYMYYAAPSPFCRKECPRWTIDNDFDATYYSAIVASDAAMPPSSNTWKLKCGHSFNAEATFAITRETLPLFHASTLVLHNYSGFR